MDTVRMNRQRIQTLKTSDFRGLVTPADSSTSESKGSWYRRNARHEIHFEPEGSTFTRWATASVRQTSILLHMRKLNRPVTLREVATFPGFCTSPSFEAMSKCFDRTRHEVRRYGADIVWDPGNQGYILKTEAPPRPKKRAQPAERWASILYWSHGIDPMPAAVLGSYTRRPDAISIEDELMWLSMCSAGASPHEFVDAYVDDGLVCVSGPTLYGKGR